MCESAPEYHRDPEVRNVSGQESRNLIACSNNLGMDLLRIDTELFDRFRNQSPFDLTFVRQCVKCSNDDTFGIDFEEPPQALASVAPSETIRAQRSQATRHPRSNLVRHDLQVVRDRHKNTLLFAKQCPNEGLPGLFLRMKHVPAFGAQSFVAQQLVAGGAPHVG